jgi:hypothetical protein
MAWTRVVLSRLTINQFQFIGGIFSTEVEFGHLTHANAAPINMVLLTSSTVGVIVTSSVICMSTFFLFLSGYALQQKSVRNIQHALRAPIPTPTVRYPYESRRTGADDSESVLGGDGEQSVLSDSGSESTLGTSGNFAYLQLLSHPDPSDICSAILFFKKIATSNTAVQDRLFMYPQEWDMVMSHDSGVNQALALLRDASTKYGIWLLPIDMALVAAQGYSLTDSKLLRLGQVQFMQYDSVLYLRTPGLLLDAQRLDDILFSRPLPLKYDRNRPESYRNEAWIPMPLRANQEPTLPPAYLITVNNLPDHVEARTHIPDVALRGFGDLVAKPGYKLPSGEDPAYVYFDLDDEGHAKWEDNAWYGQWRKEQLEECEGLDLFAT